MAGASTYLASLDLNFWLRAGAYATKPTYIYVSLHAGDVGETGTNEVITTGTGYARVQIATADANWSAPASAAGGKMRVANSAPVTYPNPIANWGTITDVGFWTLATGGSFIFGGPIGISRIINAGDVAPSFAAGILGISIA